MCVYVHGHVCASVGEVVSNVRSLCSLVLTRDACRAVSLWDCVVVGVGMALRWSGIGADVREGVWTHASHRQTAALCATASLKEVF